MAGNAVLLGLTFSWNSPIIELQPGPPFSQSARGAVPGSFRASKNQNHIFIFGPVSSISKTFHDAQKGKQTDVKVATELVDSRCRLTNASVGLEYQSGACVTVLKDRDWVAICIECSISLVNPMKPSWSGQGQAHCRGRDNSLHEPHLAVCTQLCLCCVK